MNAGDGVTLDMRDHQQLGYGSPTGPFDCTAESGGIDVAVDTNGVLTPTGRQIRLASNEPNPDRRSPGLNLPQVEAAVLKVTKGRVDLDTRVQYRSLNRTQVRNRIVDGRWASIQVNRGVLVDRGFLTGFRGGHCLTVHTIDGEPDVPILGDPLVPHFVRCSWDALFDAAEALTGGWIYTQMTRDLTPDYQVEIRPTPPATLRTFLRFYLNSAGAITGRKQFHTGGIVRRCTVPRWHPAATGKPREWGRQLVQITDGKRDGWWVDAKYAKEIIP